MMIVYLRESILFACDSECGFSYNYQVTESITETPAWFGVCLYNYIYQVCSFFSSLQYLKLRRQMSERKS